MADMKAIVFLGGGRITSALVAGLRLAGDRHRLVVYDRHPEKLRALRRECGVEIARDLGSAVSPGEMLVIAVRPGSVKEMLDEVAECGLYESGWSYHPCLPFLRFRTPGPSASWLR